MDGVKPVNETTPLLAATVTGPVAPTNEEEVLESANQGIPHDIDSDRPLPRTQIFLLCFARLVEPVAFFGIFPFIPQMIWDTGELENESSVGLVSGLIESCFSLTQMLLMILWGHAADKLGRKPVLLFSLTGVSIATALFGLSRTIWQMILFRCLAGVFAGTVVTIRAMISENSTKKTQARAFSFYSITNNVGILLGPLIGGVLSNPAHQCPSVFGKVQFFKDYKYALPAFAISAIGFSALIITALFLKETLDKEALADTKKNPPMTTWDLLKFPGVSMVVYIYGHVMLLALAYTAISTLFWYTSVEEGGFGFSPLQNALFLTGAGLSQVLWTLIVFPPLQHRVGTGGVLRICSFVWPVFFALPPLCNFFLRRHLNVAFWVLAPTSLAIGSGVSMAFTAVQLALNDIAPTPATLGTLNGIALSVVAGTRAFAPFLFSSIFAAGVKNQVLGGYLIWLILVLIALAYTAAIQWLPAKAEGKMNQSEHED